MAIQRAIIPVAGRATRLKPISTAVPKSLLPLADRAGRVRPVIHHICAEAASAGIDQVALVVSPGQRERFEAYFASARSAGDADVPERIEYVVQETPAGFGDAVLRAETFAAGKPVALFLGDHVYRAEALGPSCGSQVVAAFAGCGGVAMIGVQPVGGEQISQVGVVAGEPVGEGVYRCTAFIEKVEKPDMETARARLRTPGLPADHFLAHCGIYVFGHEIFECLAELAGQDRSGDQEIELAQAQSMLLARHPGRYYLLAIAGRAYDVGTPAGYVETFRTLAENDQEC